jgi:hypothetical protein
MKRKIISFVKENSQKENISIKNICSITDISYKTYKRWTNSNDLKDNRKGPLTLKNQLTFSEREEIISICTKP